VRAEHPKESVESEGDPEARAPAEKDLLDTGARTPSNIVNTLFDRQSSRSAKSHTSRVGRADRRRDLLWVLILYLVIVFGVIVASMVYLLS
jgi:hypothetical protein